jgi:hypothetical protein
MRNDSPAAIPARISSRSINDNRNADRGRARDRRDGRPSAATNTRWTVIRLKSQLTRDRDLRLARSHPRQDL